MNQKNYERNLARLEFIKLHIALFYAYDTQRIKDGFLGNKNELVKEIASKARRELGYSEKTNDCDLVNSLNRQYRIKIEGEKI